MYKYTPIKRRFGWPDLLVLAFGAFILYAFIGVAKHWTGTIQTAPALDLSSHALPKYAWFSFVRAFVGYSLSFVFTLVYGYVAAKLKRSEVVLIPFLDILQSVPVFGFLPGLVIGLMSIFPDSNIGLEIACVVMLATGQAWNMTFSFYYSLKSVPQELAEAGAMMRLTWLQKLREIELPFAAIGLAWNSLMSMAGGWFFLTVCESFTLENKQFHLPGIGSYMAVAIERGDQRAMIYGVIAMALVIIFVDFIIWRPVLAWVQKFKMEGDTEQVGMDQPFVTSLIARSKIMDWVFALNNRWRRERYLKKSLKRSKRAARRGHVREDDSVSRPLPIDLQVNIIRIRSFWSRNLENIREWTSKMVMPLTIALVIWAGTRLWELVRTLDLAAWEQIWRGVGFTGVRVLGAVILSTLWTVPFGIFVGLSPRLTRILQPIVQVAASFPAPMLYPLVLLVMMKVGIGIRWGSMFLMLFGVQWYILFNVLAGASTITRDLKDSLAMMGVRPWTRWKELYLPAVFPFIATGWVAAAGGAWNASIVAEYIHFNGETLAAPGIGAMICRATAAADFPRLAGCLIAMVLTVVVLNRTLWTRICSFAETRYR